MNHKKNLQAEVARLLERYSKPEIEQTLRQIEGNSDSPKSCTILINKGLHSFPDYLFRGETFVFYEGSADLSSADALEQFVVERLKALANFLKKEKWSEIGIVISGNAALCMQVKLAVFRITHIETTDWVFDGAGHYLPLRISLRSVLASVSNQARSTEP